MQGGFSVATIAHARTGSATAEMEVPAASLRATGRVKKPLAESRLSQESGSSPK